VFRQIDWSTADTVQTIDGVRRHNVRRKRFCGAR
jgi:hypothetical protein